LTNGQAVMHSVVTVFNCVGGLRDIRDYSHVWDNQWPMLLISDVRMLLSNSRLQYF